MATRTKTKKKAKKKVAKKKKKPTAKAKPAKKKASGKKKPTAKAKPAKKKPTSKGKQLPARVPKGYLADIGGYEEEEEVPLPAGGGNPWVGFYNKKASRASDVRKALGSLTMGTPYLCKDDSYYLVSGAAFVILAAFRYWATTDDTNSLIDVSMEPLAFGAKINGKTSKDCVQVVLLLLPGSSRLDRECRPAVLTVCDFRGVKAPGILSHLKEVEKSKEPKWAKKHGEIAGRAPARFRVASEWDITQKQSRSGFAYALAGSTSNVISLKQLEAIEKFFSKKDNREQLTEFKEILSGRKDTLQQIADGIEPEEPEEEDVDDAEMDDDEDLDDDGGFDEDEDEDEDDADDADDDEDYEDDDEDDE